MLIGFQMPESDIYITAPQSPGTQASEPPPSQSSSGSSGNSNLQPPPLVDNGALREFLQLCTPALEDLFAKGLDAHTLALAFHIASIFDGRRAGGQ